MRQFLTIVIFIAVLAGNAVAQSFGAVVGSFSGVTAYSNGSTRYYSGINNFVGGYNVGVKWQCVEFCRRFYLQVYGVYLPLGYNANQWYGNGMGLNRHANGGTTPPRVGDVLCWNGHIAIIREVGSNYVAVIQQNYWNNGGDNRFVVGMSTAGGRYTINSVSGMACQGWLSRSGAGGGTVTVEVSEQNVVGQGQVGFFAGGPTNWWHFAGGYGLNGQMRWTYNNGPGYGVDNWGEWRPSLPQTRNYEVYAYIPRMYGTANAKYRISSPQGTWYKVVNQNAYYDQWVSLGTYPMSAGSGNVVVLVDQTTDPHLSRWIAFDSVRFVGR